MCIAQKLLSLLANGDYQSGQGLAQQLNISRSSVWNGIKQLRETGLDIYAIRGKGYRLVPGIELLDKARIEIWLADSDVPALPAIHLFWSVASTNRYLLNETSAGNAVCLAETQTQGRGRRGRTWVSPPGGNIYYSQVYEFALGPAELSGLSLVAAVALARALKRYGIQGVKLKWPNDIYVAERKLAGILLEMSGEAAGPSRVVVGVGINIHMPEQAAKTIDQAWIDMSQLSSQPVERNRLVAGLIEEMTRSFQTFERQGFAPFQAQWQQDDLFKDRQVTVTRGREVFTGLAAGIDQQGLLLLEIDGQLRRFSSGEASLRGAPA